MHINCLFIIGGGKTQSIEGTTQGDLAAMEIYAIATIPTIPMILMLVEISLQINYKTLTAAYADEFTAARPID